MLATAAPALGQTIAVTTTADPAGPGACPNSPCSLRQAVAVASSGDTIQLAGSSASPDVYSLTQGSDITVTKSLTIQGNGVDATTIDGSGNIVMSGGFSLPVRILKVTGGTLDISGVTFTGGVDDDDEIPCNACDTLILNGGGALFNQGASVTLDGVAFDSNGGDTPVGGAISNAGTLDMTNVSFTNDNGAYGGALSSRGGTVKADGVTFDSDGPGAFEGGAVFAYEGGTATFVNTTVVNSGWASSRGGGIANDGATLTLTNDTLSGNVRGSLETDAGSTSVENTILGSGFSDSVDFDCVTAGRPAGDGATTAKAITDDLGHNVDQDGACDLNAAGDQSMVDPQLASLADNGGPTLTEALLPGSPAIDGADDPACPAADQRGVARPQGECDIGAFQVGALQTTSTTTATSATSSTATTTTTTTQVAPAVTSPVSTAAPTSVTSATSAPSTTATTSSTASRSSSATSSLPRGGVGAIAALACTDEQVVLIDVVPDGSHVLITGAARQVLAGRRVSIRLLATHKVVATPVVTASGSFSASVPLPNAAIRDTNAARYEASVGAAHSQALKLERRAYLLGATRSGSRVSIIGRVTGSFQVGAPVTIVLRVTCASYRVVARVKLTRRGMFSADVPAPHGAASAIAVYRAQTTVLDRGHSEPTFTLPTPPTES